MLMWAIRQCVCCILESSTFSADRREEKQACECTTKDVRQPCTAGCLTYNPGSILCSTSDAHSVFEHITINAQLLLLCWHCLNLWFDTASAHAFKIHSALVSKGPLNTEGHLYVKERVLSIPLDNHGLQGGCTHAWSTDSTVKHGWRVWLWRFVSFIFQLSDHQLHNLRISSSHVGEIGDFKGPVCNTERDLLAWHWTRNTYLCF